MRLHFTSFRRPAITVVLLAALAAAPTAAARGATPAAAKPAPHGVQQGERQGPQPSSRASRRPASRRTSRGVRARASHITTNPYAYCRQGSPFMRIEAYTPSGVPALNTTSGIDRQRVWWRTHAYESTISGYRYRDSGPWFYTDLNESTRPRSSSYWIHAQSGVNNYWASQHQTFANFGHKIRIELQWDQNGVAVHRDAQFLNSANADYRLDGRGPISSFCYMFNLEGNV